MAKIKLQNMMFFGCHGVYDYEREYGQKFFLDVEMETGDDKAGATDNLADAVDYTAVYRLVKQIVETKQFQLMEALLGHIDRAVLAEFPLVSSVTTRVRKPAVPIAGQLDFVQVEMSRSR